MKPATPAALPWMLLMAFGGALSLSLGESQRAFAVNRWLGLSLLLRRTLVRTLALGLVGVGLAELVAGAAGLVWHDLDLFLLRHEKLPGADLPHWPWAWVRLAGGLALCAATLPRPVNAVLGGCVGWCTALVCWATCRTLPLRLGHDARLLQLAAGGVLLGVAAAAAGWLRDAPEAGRVERRLAREAGLGAALLALLSALWLAPAGATWVRASFALAVSLGLSWRLAAVAYAGEPRSTWRAVEHRLVADLHGRQAQAWLLLGALVGIWHWGLVFVALPAAERWNRHQVIDQFTAWPEVLTGVERPTAADWNKVAHRLRGTLGNYRPHPWAGRYLLLVAWVEATRLQHVHRARLLLREAVDTWPGVRAVAPPGWPGERTVGGIARAVLRIWGPLLDPGSRPA